MALKTNIKYKEFEQAAVTSPMGRDITLMGKVLTFAGSNLFDQRGNFIPINWWNIVKLIQIAKFVIDLIRWIVEKSKEDK